MCSYSNDDGDTKSVGLSISVANEVYMTVTISTTISYFLKMQLPNSFHAEIVWNLSNPDTNGIEKGFHLSPVFVLIIFHQ